MFYYCLRGVKVSIQMKSNRRILNDAAKVNKENDTGDTGIVRFSDIFKGVQKYIGIMLKEKNVRTAISLVLCLAVLSTSVVILTNIRSKSQYAHASYVCTHVCTNDCTGVKNEHIMMTVFDSNIVDEPGAVLFNHENMKLHTEGGENIYVYSIDTYSPVVSNFNNQISYEPVDMTEAYRASDVFAINEPKVPLSDVSVTGEAEEADETDEIGTMGVLEETDEIDAADEIDSSYALNVKEQQDQDEEEFTGFTLTIIVKGEDGMAVGNMLPEDTMKPTETYVIRELNSGEMFILAAGPFYKHHFVHWEAFYTDDEEQKLILNSKTSDPPASAKLFIMPEANITIVIEFTDVDPDLLPEAQPFEAKAPETQALLPDKYTNKN